MFTRFPGQERPVKSALSFPSYPLYRFFSFITFLLITLYVSARLYTFPNFFPARFCRFTSDRSILRSERPRKKAQNPRFCMRLPFRRGNLYMQFLCQLPAAFTRPIPVYPDPFAMRVCVYERDFPDPLFMGGKDRR